MLKILIADDEELERRAIKSIIQRKYEHEITIYEAKNGREAIEISDIERPDIVIMDIKMPGINGIEAIKEIQKHLKNTYTMILTAYDYFDFAKEAIEYNVREYILKPLNREIFVEKLNKAFKEIEKKKLDKSQELELREKFFNMLPILENEICQCLVNNTLENIDYHTYLDYLNVRFRSGYCMLIKINEKYSYVNLSDKEKLNIKREVSDYLKEIINRFYKALVSWNFSHNNIVVFIQSLEEEDYNIRLEGINLGRKLRRDIKEKYNISLSIGIGRRYKGIEEFNKSYSEAYMSLKYHIKDVNVKHFQDICAIIGEEYVKDVGNSDKNYLQVKGIKDVINDLYDSNKEGQKSILLRSISYIKSNYNQDISLEKVADKFNLSPYYYSRIFKEFTGKNYSEYITYIRIENAKHMLAENSLSVKEIGFKIGYNDPNYFSRVFKKVLGISPTEYKIKVNNNKIK